MEGDHDEELENYYSDSAVISCDGVPEFVSLIGVIRKKQAVVQ